MRTLPQILAMLLATSCCFAGLMRIPEIPRPTLTAPEAITLAGKQLGNDPKFVLIAVEWCQASKFQPRVSDGTQFRASQNAPEAWSWFVTYLYKEEAEAKVLNPPRPQPTWTSVMVVQVQNDGSAGIMVGERD